MLTDQSASGLNRGLSSYFGWLRNVNHGKFTEECTICAEKQVLVKKILTNGLRMVCFYECESKTYRLTSKEKVLDEAVNKEGHADSVLGHKRTHHN